MNVYITSALIGLLGMLIGVLAGGRLARNTAIETAKISHKNAIDIMRRQEFHKAATEFRILFQNIIYRLRINIKTGDVEANTIINESDIVKQTKAKILIDPYIPIDSIEGFNMAWEQYKNTEKDYFKSISIDPHQRSTNNRKILSSHYLSHIEKLLSYTDPKL